MRVRFCVCVCGVRAVIGTQNDQEERCFFSEAAAQPRSHKSSTQQYSRSTAVQKYSSSTAEVQQQHSSSTAVSAAQQQRHNGNRAPSSRLCASSRGVCACGCCNAKRNRTTTPTRPPQQWPNTFRRTSYQVYEAYSSSKISTVAQTCIYHWNACASPLLLKTRPGWGIKPTPSQKGNLV